MSLITMVPNSSQIINIIMSSQDNLFSNDEIEIYVQMKVRIKKTKGNRASSRKKLKYVFSLKI